MYNFDESNFNKKFTMYYLIFNKPKANTNAQPNISRDILKNILLPNLPLQHQEEIVKFLDNQFEKYDINKLNKQIPIFKLLIDKQYDIIEELLQLYYGSMTAKEEYKKQKKQIQGLFKLILFTNSKNCQYNKLGNIVDFNKTGKTISESDRQYSGEDKIPYYGTGGITGYTKDFMFNGEYLIFSQDGSVGNVTYINGKFWCNHHIRVINFKENINIFFIFNYLKVINYANITKTNSIPNITWTLLKELKIPIPSIDKQEEIIKNIEKLENELTHYKEYSNMLQTELDNIIDMINKI
jgi:type I restriction enzyme S subunit